MNELKNFFDLVVDVWQNGLLGIDISRYAISIFIFAVFLFLRRLFTRTVLIRLKRWADKTRTRIDNDLLEALEKPIRNIPVVLGIFFAVQYLHVSGVFADFSQKLIRSFITFLIFWSFFNLVAPLSFLFERIERLFTHALSVWSMKAVKALIVFIGAATILEIWGIKIGPIIAGLGLFGVAVALGAQDLFKNLISGILVIAERRFVRGDWIFVDGLVEGTVESIGFRSTLIRRFDKAPVYVPNSKLSDNVVTNFSKMTHRRIYWTVRVEYGATVEQLRRIRDQIEAYLLQNDDFAKPPEAELFVRIDKFADSSVDFILYCFTRATGWGAWLKTKEELACRIKEIVEEAGTAFAFPSQSVYVNMEQTAKEDRLSPCSAGETTVERK